MTDSNCTFPLPPERKTLQRNVCFAHDPRSAILVVPVGVSKLGPTGLTFVKPGVKVNGAYYRDILLLLPDIRHIASEFFIFQQYNAPGQTSVICLQ